MATSPMSSCCRGDYGGVRTGTQWSETADREPRSMVNHPTPICSNVTDQFSNTNLRSTFDLPYIRPDSSAFSWGFRFWKSEILVAALLASRLSRSIWSGDAYRFFHALVQTSPTKAVGRFTTALLTKGLLRSDTTNGPQLAASSSISRRRSLRQTRTTRTRSGSRR